MQSVEKSYLLLLLLGLDLRRQPTPTQYENTRANQKHHRS
jgi:hypothetical protein